MIQVADSLPVPLHHLRREERHWPAAWLIAGAEEDAGVAAGFTVLGADAGPVHSFDQAAEDEPGISLGHGLKLGQGAVCGMGGMGGGGGEGGGGGLR